MNLKEFKTIKQALSLGDVSGSYRKCKSCNDKVEVSNEQADLIDAGTMLCTCEKPRCLDFGLIELGWPMGYGSK